MPNEKKKDSGLTPKHKPEMNPATPDYNNTVRLPGKAKSTEPHAPKTARFSEPQSEKPAGSAEHHTEKPAKSADHFTAKPEKKQVPAPADSIPGTRVTSSRTFPSSAPVSAYSPFTPSRPAKSMRAQPSLSRPAATEKPSRLPKISDEKMPNFYQQSASKPKNIKEKKKGALRVIPLGGLDEIGKNMTLLEFANDIIIVDCGMAFPEEDMPGIDAVIQDYTYVIQNKDRVRGIFITHGHEDHIGALPYLMRELKCPIYGGKLAIELIRGKLTDKGTGTRGVELKHCVAGDVVKAGGSFAVEFIRVNHSIADAFALAIRTPAGVVIHTGDFKVDYTPIDGEPIDLQRFAQYGSEGVLLLLADSTNVEVPGSSPSERQVGESFQRIFQNAPGRLIVATFSSHVHRMQQIFTAAEKFNRKVALVGRSMLNVFAAANSLGYIEMKPDTLIDINEIDRYQPEQIVILTTGSQAEPMAALTRMAYASHKIVEIHQGDTVILSANRIPGNEKPIYRVINELFRLGATVIYEALADVHVSGHAYRNELQLIHQLVKPRYFMPVHGEYRMLFRHAQLSHGLGQSWNNIFILNNGDIFECSKDMARISGYINAAAVLIDGSGVGDLDNRVLRDRRLLADDGIVAITLVVDKKGKLLAAPGVQAMGFLYESESAQVIKDSSEKLTVYIGKCSQQNRSIHSIVDSGQLRDYLKSLLFEKTKRRPMILISLTQV